MSIQTQSSANAKIDYPESDGQPMADNTLQFRWIVTLQGGLENLFREDPLVFVAGDLFWYPVEGNNTLRTAPDVMVAFGRPKGDRGSYRQWEEEGIAPQVVFEVLSPGNRVGEMLRKLRFYERFGVDEYYVFDPDHGELTAWIRDGDRLEELERTDGWTSPRLGVRFEFSSGELQVIRPDGRRFATYLELAEQQEEERQRAEMERQRAEMERQRAEVASSRAERLEMQLRALGVEPAP
jgi:Uma2 family endonuclease